MEQIKSIYNHLGNMIGSRAIETIGRAPYLGYTADKPRGCERQRRHPQSSPERDGLRGAALDVAVRSSARHPHPKVSPRGRQAPAGRRGGSVCRETRGRAPCGAEHRGTRVTAHCRGRLNPTRPHRTLVRAPFGSGELEHVEQVADGGHVLRYVRVGLVLDGVRQVVTTAPAEGLGQHPVALDEFHE